MQQVEKNIIELLSVKDKRAIELIYDHYSASLYGVILRMVKDENDANDILQEGFIKIWQNSTKFDSSKARLFTWLMTICRNTAIDKLRSKGNRAQKEIQKEDVNVYDNRRVQLNPDLMDIRDKVNQLDKKYIDVIDALYFNGMTQKEASEYLDLPLGTVKSRVKIALRELRGVFGNKLLSIILIVLLWMIS